MFRIGDFSRIARVSARLLRFYDELGLFVPAHADEQTGYRYYAIEQLAELNRILVLKELGFNLDQVRDILRAKVDPSELRNMLVLRRNDVEQTLALEARRLQQIETRIAQLESDGDVERGRRHRARRAGPRNPVVAPNGAVIRRGARSDPRTARAGASAAAPRLHAHVAGHRALAAIRTG